MYKSFRRFLGLGLLGVMLAMVVVPATFASPQSKKKGGKKGGKSGKGAPKKGGRGGSK
jgi:hypothetical protein